MRKLTIDERTSILRCLTEGTSISSTARICGKSKVTVLRLLADVGSLCADLHNELVRNLDCRRVQVDELWSFVGCKEKSRKEGKQGAGDAWTWCGIDADSKLIVAYLVGLRELSYARAFIQDIADRLKNRIQLTSDGLKMYISAVLDAFGTDDIDFAMLLKIYGSSQQDTAGQARYSPAECIGCLIRPMLGDPDPKHISTSFSERMNLTTRMCNRRFTRLTNAFSKKWRNHEHAIALHYFVYNFIRKHLTLGTTPAVAAGITDRVWKIEDLVGMLVAREEQNKCHGRINRADKA
jgi:IS1 family transposase